MAKKFIVETSARHLHVTKEDLATLFGPCLLYTSARKFFSAPIKAFSPALYMKSEMNCCEERMDCHGCVQSGNPEETD